MSEFDTRKYWESRHAMPGRFTGVGFVGLGEAFNTWMYRVRRWTFMRTVTPLIQGRRGLEILDLGSGTGFYLDLWLGLDRHNVVGSDLSAAAVENLQRAYPCLEILQLDISEDEESLPRRQFDVISVFDVLFHIVDDHRYARAVENLAHLLRPGGLLIFSENFLHVDTVRTAEQVSRPIGEIESLLSEAGFQRLLRRPMFFMMNYPMDSTNRYAQLCWLVFSHVVARWDRVGGILGRCLYPLEIRLLSRGATEGPSTEIMVCKKVRI